MIDSYLIEETQRDKPSQLFKIWIREPEPCMFSNSPCFCDLIHFQFCLMASLAKVYIFEKILLNFLFPVGFSFTKASDQSIGLPYRSTYSYIEISIVCLTSCGFLKVFSFHLFTEKPKQYSSRILRDQKKSFVAQCFHFQRSDYYASLSSTFERL